MAIRKSIEEGTWKEFLPSERHLCKSLQVSRPTVRAALQQLAKDGLINIRHGRLKQILRAGRRVHAARSRLIVIVAHEPVVHTASEPYHIITEMRAHLTQQGFVTEIFLCQARSAVTQQRQLEAFLRQNRVLCCVLLSVRLELQRWFATHSIPALVLGSCHASVRLPSLDIDHRAVCRHAVGVLLAKGHRRFAFVVPDSGVAGDLAGEKGFLESVEQHPHSIAQAMVVRHNGTAQNIVTKLDAIFMTSRAPTAFLVAMPQDVFTVLIYLLRRGLLVPDMVSLIARDDDILFSKIYPPVAHYHVDGDVFNHRLTRLILKLASRGGLPPDPNLIIPRFIAGATLRTSTDS